MDGLVLTKHQLKAWLAASKAQRKQWMEATEEVPAAIVEIGGRDAVVFTSNDGPDPVIPLVTYEEGVDVAIVLCGANEEVIRVAVEEPELEDAISDDFVVGGPLLVVDLTDDWHASDPPTFELTLTEGSFCVDLREVGEEDGTGQVLVFWLPDEA